MGTSGKNKFGEYRQQKRSDAKKSGKPRSDTGDGGQGSGAKVASNKCAEQINNVSLEEVARCAYYNSRHAVPQPNTAVSVSEELVQSRIAVTTGEGEMIGYLPVEYNYLRRCLKDGFSYSGVVTSSAVNPIPAVKVNLSGQQK